MAAPPKEGLTFDPSGTRAIALAYEAALQIAGEEGSPFAIIPGYELRQWLAGLILAEARQGPLETERLTQAALRGLRLRASASDLSAYCVPSVPIGARRAAQDPAGPRPTAG